MIRIKSKGTLQLILNDIELYSVIWGLNVNTKKTKAMLFEKDCQTSCDMFLNNVKIELFDSFKYLGGMSSKMETGFEPRKGSHNMHHMHYKIF